MSDLTLVTGGAGFIGSHVVDALLASGSDVRVVDDFSTGREENLDDAWRLAAEHGAGLQVLAGDVRDEVRMRDAADGCSGVIHLAAVVSVPRSVEDPVGCDSVTHGGTVNVLRQAVEAGADRFVLASSCAVYGDATEPPIAEAASTRPLSPYADAKLAAEEVCAEAADAGQITAVSLRFFNVYGPRQDPGSAYSGVISRFLAAAASGEAVTIYGDGRQTRDFVYVADVVAAVLAALRRPLTGTSVLNVGTGRQADLLQVLNVIEDQSGRSVGRRMEAARDGDIRHSRADAGRARWVLGWEAGTRLDDGLAETWSWFAGAGAPAEPAPDGDARA
ncbi:MAG: NAD-dependent epimerase/dehydratase family protein [Thermoleophilia bacterium]|nr:NAD-dependent epimerase/dehydratase family protein [Thermoleophilia bacterium]